MKILLLLFMMSYDVRIRNNMQRRLGTLRNSYPPSIMINRNVMSAPCGIITQGRDDVMNYGDLYVTSSNELYREKLRKLHQIRMDNATFRYRSKSEDNNPSIILERKELRCSTAPTFGSENSLIKPRPCINPRQIQTARRSKRCRAFTKQPCCSTSGYPLLDVLYNDITRYPTPPPPLFDQNIGLEEKSESGVLFKRPASSRVNPRLQKVNRIMSAPLLQGYVASHRQLSSSSFEEKARISKRASHPSSSSTDNFKRESCPALVRKKPLLLTSAKAALSKGQLIRIEEAPLGIVGEQCTPRKPRQMFTHNKSSAKNRLNQQKAIVSDHLSKHQQATPAIDPPPSPRTIRLIPLSPPKPSSGCTCRSVRFSCTDNLIHEYEATEPIRNDCDVFE